MVETVVVPATCVPCSRISCSTSENRARISLEPRKRRSPAAVGVTCLALRERSFCSYRDSSARICWLTADCVTWLSCAARENEPVSTTSQNIFRDSSCIRSSLDTKNLNKQAYHSKK